MLNFEIDKNIVLFVFNDYLKYMVLSYISFIKMVDIWYS